ncbi:MAG: sigma 54-interacting transcriptional regulator [bacterium]
MARRRVRRRLGQLRRAGCLTSLALHAAGRRRIESCRVRGRSNATSGARDSTVAGFEALQELIPILAASLDVRTLFPHISTTAKQVLAHDLMALAIMRSDGRGGQLYALSGPRTVRERYGPEFTPELMQLLAQDYVVAHHLTYAQGDPKLTGTVRTPLNVEPLTVGFDLEPEWIELLGDAGHRSLLQVPLRLAGSIVGHVTFFSRDPTAYEPADSVAASRIADFVALAVGHERLAEAEREAAVARERNALLEARVDQLSRELAARGGARVPVGSSAPWRTVLAQAAQVAATETTVLLTGESGTGKEVLARFIHGASPRASGPFVALNCAALPEHLLESEVFGHEKGAFTGAAVAHPGRIEQANGGTLFLDEVGEMSLAVQAKFLRALEEREFQRLGSARTIRADVRVIAATNRDLPRAVLEGRFREDLYYRLHVFGIHIPPLRERRDDILKLVDHFLTEIGASMGRPSSGLSVDARAQVLKYPWPGNVRELRNAIERAVILCGGGLVLPEHLPMAAAPPVEPPRTPRTVGAAGASTEAEHRALPAPSHETAAGAPIQGQEELDRLEREMILRALRETGQNKSKAARLLGLTRAQLYSRIEKHRLA